MAALDRYNPMGSMGYSMPPALSGYDFTPAQLHARNTEPAVTMFTGADGNLYPAGHPMLTQQDAILSDDTDKTGAYLGSLTTSRQEAAAEAHRRKMLTPSAELHGNAMQVGGNSNLPANDPDAVYMSLVKRYLDEGFGQKEAEEKANAQMEKSRLQLLKENSAELGTFMMDKLGPDGERNYWPYIPFADTELGRNGLVINGFDGEQIAKFGGEDAEVTEAREALPSLQDAQRMLDINDPIGRTGGALTNPSTDTNTGNGTGNTVVTKDNGALTAPSKPTQSTVRSTTGGYTGNARGSDLPDMQIGLGERLMRMGAAGMAAGGQGGLAQLGAMFGASADVNQANRQGAMDTFKIEEERRQAHANRVAQLAASGSKGAGDGGDLSFDTANQINDMQMALSALKSGALTGVWDAGVKGWMDKHGMTDDFNELTGFYFGGEKGIGARRAHIRNILQNIKVNDALAIAAKTKGAISDTEMKLFLSPFPTQFQDEGVWIEMLESKLRILQKIQGSSGSGRQPSKEPLFTAANGVKVFAE